jgi:ribonuclease P protein component
MTREPTGDLPHQRAYHSDRRLRPAERVRRRRDFEAIFRLRCEVRDDLIRILGGWNGLNWPRLGVAVSRRFGSAVRRNRCKRLIREAFRQQKSLLPAGIDLIVTPIGTRMPTLRELVARLPQMVARLTEQLRGRAAR